MNKYLSLTIFLTIAVILCYAQQYGSFKDPRDGRVYKTVKIGNQVWMAENLNADRFRNGDIIPQAKTDDEWKAASENGKPAWCYYDNDSKNGEKYGKLYNLYAVSDPRRLAPKGWHVASDEEWTVLTNYLGGAEKAGAKMKSKTDWFRDSNGTNSSGFSGLPGGSLDPNVTFKNIGYNGYWWSSTEFNTSSRWSRSLGSYVSDIGRYIGDYRAGYSVRCIKD